tara:strand:- start:1265 stop:2077 length:813 start_codon:yes stop_codon:yes gene_type:complete
MQNDRKEINLIGGGFQHSPSTSGYDPLFVKWIKGKQTAPVSMYVDYSIKQPTNPNTKNYAWLVESKTINTDLYRWCENNIDYLKQTFVSVFTHDVELSKLSEIFVLTLCSAKSFISSGDVYNKTKLVSMVASNKVMCEEHRVRQKIINKYSQLCDHYGRGFNPIDNKSDGIKDYCFSFAMENATYSNMFTEKITDCFMTGTIPIYYGIPNIGDFFNEEGIIILDGDFNIDNLSFDLYNSKLNAVYDNFKISNELLVAEDYIYKHFLKYEI